MDSKQSFEKHQKYLNFYDDRFGLLGSRGMENMEEEEEFWGIGIENESYLMSEELETVTNTFIQDNHKPERYSVNYWRNYQPKPLMAALAKLPKQIQLPIYINSYLFRNADLLGEHETTYTSKPQPNPKFSGETIDQHLKRVSPEFSTLFEKNMIYDGDTFEFTTFNFYKASVIDTVKELIEIKRAFLAEVNKRLVSKFTIFKQKLKYPSHNYGFAKFMSNPKNVAICNNGTYHINITLPTKLSSNGTIKNPELFKTQHANAIKAIQWIEPFLIALYGSPDILHTLDPAYSQGSQRLAFSRYIGLGTYDTTAMEKGKLLDTYKYKEDNQTYFTEMHVNSPYKPPETIGYDFNYNKFKNHGIEFRVLDWFPEEHLEPIINLLILVCEHSRRSKIPDPRECLLWRDFSRLAIMKGSSAKVTPALYFKVNEVFGLATSIFSCWPFCRNTTILNTMNKLSGHLYTKYRFSDLCSKMSPAMKPIRLVDYNTTVKNAYREMFTKTNI